MAGIAWMNGRQRLKTAVILSAGYDAPVGLFMLHVGLRTGLHATWHLDFTVAKRPPNYIGRYYSFFQITQIHTRFVCYNVGTERCLRSLSSAPSSRWRMQIALLV